MFRILAIAALALLCGLPALSAKELKIATQAPERSTWGKALADMAEEIEKATGGDVELKIYYGGIQGTERSVIRKVRIRQLDGAAFMGQGISTVIPDTMVLQLPLIFQDVDEATATLAHLRGHFDKQAQKRGFEVIGWTHLGFTYAFSKNKIDSLEDFRRAKPWLIEDDAMVSAFFEELKVTPVSAGVADVLTALQSGLIRTVFAPPLAMMALQWHSRVDYFVDLKLGYSVGSFKLARPTWRRLSADQREAVARIAETYFKKVNAKVHEQNQEALEGMLGKLGIARVRPDDDSIAKFKAATERVADRTAVKLFSASVLADMRAFLKQYREKQ